jgi:hypothetical protein
MEAVAKVVTELFMIVLSVVAIPAGTKESRLDIIQHSGQVETLVVRRTEAGFSLLEQQGEKLAEKGTIRFAEGKKDVYLLKLGDVPEQTFDLPASLKDFSLDGLRKAARFDLKAKDGVVIHVYRSGGAIYLTPERSRTTYACH